MEKNITLILSESDVVEILASLSYARDFYTRQADFNYRDYWEKAISDNRKIDNNILSQCEEQRIKDVI